MGIEINLTGNNFDKDQWRRELGNVAYTGSAGSILPLSMLQLHPDEADLILFDEEAPRAASVEAQVWILPEGGIRGVTVKNDGAGITLSMPTGTGVGDWRIAQALANAGVECGAEIDVDGEQIPTGAALDLGEWQRKSWDSTVASLSTLIASGHAEISLPLLANLVHLELSAEQIGSPTLHDDLVARVNRFGEAHYASTLTVQTPAGTTLSLNVAGGLPTMIERDSDGLILHDAPASMDALSQPLFDGAPVPTATYLELLGDQLESAGPLVYVPLMNYSAMMDIFPKLHAAAIAGEFGTAGGDETLLARGPILVFLMIAGADGNIDEKETAVFQSLLANGEHAPGEVFSKMLGDAEANFRELFVAMGTSGSSPQKLFVEFLQALDRCPPPESLLARQGLYALGHTIAAASGGFLGFGSKISRSEREALKALQTMLGVEPDEFMGG